MSVLKLKQEKAPLVQLKGIYKSYGHIEALKDIYLNIYPGQVLALVGDNGAGKSTLTKIIAGVISPDRGHIIIDGHSHFRLNPAQAIKYGIASVYQDLALVDCRDVPTNIFLGQEIMSHRFFIDKRRMTDESGRLLADLKIDIPEMRNPVGVLSGGQRQGVAVARAVHQGGRLILFDEPTAAMGVRESEKTLKLIKRLGRAGYAVMVISHNLHHVFALSERICVLSRGELKGDFATCSTSPEEIIKIITGVEDEETQYQARS